MDGQRNNPIPLDADLLATLSEDSAEALFNAVFHKAGWELVGRYSPRDGKVSPCDVYDAPTVSRIRGDTQPRIKRYCFDSRTKLLRWIYRAPGPGAPAATVQFDGWRIIAGQAFPTTITRQVGGKTDFTFQAQQTAVAPQGDVSVFRPGKAVSSGR